MRRTLSAAAPAALAAVMSAFLGLGTSCGGTVRVASTEEQAEVDCLDAQPEMPLEDMLARAKKRDYWPTKTQDWKTNISETRLATDACKAFDSYLFPPADTDAKTAKELGVSVGKLKDEQRALRSDGALVVHKGKIVYENYVGPYKGHPEKRHCMWSASKSASTAIYGAIALQSDRKAAGEVAPHGKLTPAGKTLDLRTKVSEMMDATILSSDPRFGDLTAKNLLEMSPNLKWNEGYDGNLLTSDVVHMLWEKGTVDMAALAGAKEFGPEGPGNRFIYSSGNAVILMRALKEIYGNEYDRMPWDLLFDPLGMSSAVLERDRKGTFVGSSYVHTTLRDLARLGYAYLNGGYYDGKQVIRSDFIQKAREVTPGMLAAGTTDEMIEEEGAFYSLGWWLNTDPKELQKKGLKTFGDKLQKKFFPNTPTDVFMANGHYGQNILIFPKDDLMIIRMSHDNEYFSKLDNMMSKARACFIGKTCKCGN